MHFPITLFLALSALCVSASRFHHRKRGFPLPAVLEVDVNIEDKFNLSILTPDLQARRSSKLILANGVKVFIVSDPGIVKAGAALSVETGSWRDPEGVSGLGTFFHSTNASAFYRTYAVHGVRGVPC
jgi:hypothetical protein